MSGLNPLVVKSSLMASVANCSTIEIQFTGSAPGTNGAVLSPATIHSAVADKVYLGLAGTTDGASAVLTATRAGTIVQDPNRASLSTALTNLKTGLVNHFASANLEAVADGAECVTFAVGGLGAVTCLKAELEWVSISASGTNMVKRSTIIGPSLDLGDTVALDGSNLLLKLDGSTAIDLDADPLITCQGVVFGAFKIRDTGTSGSEFEANQHVILRLTIRQ